MKTNSHTLIHGIAEARKNGFDHEFRYEDGHIIERKSKNKYKPDSVEIVKYLRYEGASNPDDSSILFLIKCSDGIKGYISSAYGIYADPKFFDFMKKADSDYSDDHLF